MAWRNVVITKHCKISTKLKLLVAQTDDDVYQFPLDDLGTVMISTTQAVVTANAMITSEFLRTFGFVLR